MRIILKGDFEGHPFRGNQYDEGSGGGSHAERMSALQAERDKLQSKLTKIHGAKKAGVGKFIGGNTRDFTEAARKRDAKGGIEAHQKYVSSLKPGQKTHFTVGDTKLTGTIIKHKKGSHFIIKEPDGTLHVVKYDKVLEG
jgi:hypothetical protein